MNALNDSTKVNFSSEHINAYTGEIIHKENSCITILQLKEKRKNCVFMPLEEILTALEVSGVYYHEFPYSGLTRIGKVEWSLI